MEITIQLDDPEFLAGIVIAEGVKVAPSPEGLQKKLQELIHASAQEEFSPELKEAIRALLKRGGFKPSGRNKPASEYLAQAAREGRFPAINNLVDINNYISLKSGLPISLLDQRATGPRVLIRYGTDGEKYVFNNAGQEIELEGLICTCRIENGNSTPVGNAIKDSMTGKLKADTREVIGVAYACTAAVTREQLQSYLDEFSELLKQFGSASSVKTEIGRAHLLV